jgi:hypothetical protein
MMDNYTNVSGSVEIYYPRAAIVFASVCAVLFSIVGVIGEYRASKCDETQRVQPQDSTEINGFLADLFVVYLTTLFQKLRLYSVE